MTAAESTDNLLAERLLGFTRRLHRAQRRRLAPLGITPAQSRVLRLVSDEERPPRMADLARALDVVPRAVTTLVDALEAAALVRRVTDPANRRVIRVELTEEGSAALERLRRARREAAEELLAPLSAEQRGTLAGLLAELEGGPETARPGACGGQGS